MPSSTTASPTCLRPIAVFAQLRIHVFSELYVAAVTVGDDLLRFSACRSGTELLREVKQRCPDTQWIHPHRLFADIGAV